VQEAYRRIVKILLDLEVDLYVCDDDKNTFKRVMEIGINGPSIQLSTNDYAEELWCDNEEKSGTTEGKEVSVAPGQISANLRRK
jgi:hypothetical protein